MDVEIAEDLEDKDNITVVPLCCAESPLSKVNHSLVSHAVSCMLVFKLDLFLHKTMCLWIYRHGNGSGNYAGKEK